MKKALIIILVIIGLIAAIGVGYLTSLDGKYKVSKSIDINATPQQVAAAVADFNTWPSWSPWVCLEPTAEVKISGQGNQIGSIMEWKGDMIGTGEMELLTIDTANSITQEVRFIEPFKSKSHTSFTFTPQEKGVTLTWEMTGEMPFLFRFLTQQMLPLIGNDFDRGLRMLKDYIEKGTVASNVEIKGTEQFNGLTYVGKSEICETALVGEKMKQTFYEVGNWLVERSTFPEEGISIYKQFDISSTICDYTSGFKLSDKSKTFPYPGAKVDSIPAGKVVRVVFKGDYQHLGNAWTAAYMYLQHNSIDADPKRHPFEVYLNDPAFFPNPADWVTEVYIPVL